MGKSTINGTYVPFLSKNVCIIKSFLCSDGPARQDPSSAVSNKAFHESEEADFEIYVKE